ncbi:hypothetical protein ACF06V_11565 [Streptomyces bobili]|uniref:hypothetical protein n=1 Tax=Streptomyces bobili TaxID=67280 RepID=UPI0037028939
MADRAEDASDQQLREYAETVLQICQRLADRRYSALLDAEQIAQVDVAGRDPIRFAIGAVLSLVLSGAFMAVLNLLGISDGLEAVAIGASVAVSAVIVFGGRAVEKLAALGLLPGNSGRAQQ